MTTRRDPDLLRAAPRTLKYGVDVFGVDQAARILGVSPRTFSKWVDAGLLPSYRVGTSKRTEAHRRVTCADLMAFARSQGIPVNPVAGRESLAVHCAVKGVETVTEFILGVMIGGARVARVVVGCEAGYAEAVRLTGDIRLADPTIRVGVWLTPSVRMGVWDRKKFDAVFAADANGELTEFLTS